MRVLVAERPETPTPREGRVGFDACLRDSDILTLHCPLSDDTEKLISDRELALIGGQGYLINTARGALVDEHALASALRERRIAGAGLDVLSQEPPGDDNPLLDQSLPNLVITPHCAWGSFTARRRIVAQTAANIRAYVAGVPERVIA
jgi:glycerate dehydrogenase